MAGGEKKPEAIDGYAIRYHANGTTRWPKGKTVDGELKGYWEQYRVDETLKRSGYRHRSVVVGEWITYDKNGDAYKVTDLAGGHITS